MYVCVNTYGDEKKKKKVEVEESWEMMMMMMMRMGGSVPHLDFDFVDGDWTMFQWKVACVLQGVSVERNDISKQNNHSLYSVHSQPRQGIFFSTTPFSNLSFKFQPSTQVRSKRQFQSTPLHLNPFFSFLVIFFWKKKKNSVLYMIFFIYFKMKILTNAFRNILLREW